MRVTRDGYNDGYGGALKTGMIYADTEFVAWFDADDEHRNEDLIEKYDAKNYKISVQKFIQLKCF